jgi:hypothetical protein
VVPTNDNASPAEIKALSHERKILVTPSVDEIMRQVEDEDGNRNDVERNAAGQIIRIGKLRFSDGAQCEWSFRLQPGSTTKVEGYYRRMEAGAMLGTREEPDVSKGGPGYTDSERTVSNRYFAEMLGTQPARYITGVRRPRWAHVTRHDAQRWLDEAVANTPVMPPVQYLPPGLPCGSRRVSDSFVGMKVSATGQSGAIAWTDISHAIASREAWEESIAAMNADLAKRRETDPDATDHIATLDAAMKAQSYAKLGVTIGQAPEYARRKGGKHALTAANNNLAEAMRRAAA